MTRVFVLASLALFASVEAGRYKYSLPGQSMWPWKSDWGALKRRLNGDLFVRGEEGYNLTDLYSLAYVQRRTNSPQPACIAFPATVDDVQKIVKFARAHRMRVAVFNTGHNSDLRSSADNVVLIHMRKMKSVTVDLDTPSATVGGGCQCRDIATAVYQASGGTLMALTGSAGSVGTWGWSTGGGASMLSGLYGLGADSILAATVVTGDGEVVTATMTNEHKDLLWAIKGAGPSFAVGISLTVKLFPRPQTVYMHVGLYVQSDTVSNKFAELVASEPDNAWSYYLVFQVGYVSVLSFCADAGCSDYMAARAAAPGCIPTPGTMRCMTIPMKNFPFDYFAIFESAVPKGRHEYIFGAVKEEDMSQSLSEVNAWLLKPEAITVTKQCFGETLLGGAVRTTDPTGELTSIAPGFRETELYFVCGVFFGDNLSLEDQHKAIDLLMDFERTKVAPRSPHQFVYWNDASNIVDGKWGERYWGSADKYERLVAIKHRYDKHDTVTCHHAVGWESDKTVDPVLCPGNCSCSNTPDGSCAVYESDRTSSPSRWWSRRHRNSRGRSTTDKSKDHH